MVYLLGWFDKLLCWWRGGARLLYFHTLITDRVMCNLILSAWLLSFLKLNFIPDFYLHLLLLRVIDCITCGEGGDACCCCQLHFNKCRHYCGTVFIWLCSPLITLLPRSLLSLSTNNKLEEVLARIVAPKYLIPALRIWTILYFIKIL